MVLDITQDKRATEAMDILTVEDFDAVQFIVGNAYQSAYYFYHAFGFKPIAWSSLKTGNRDYASYVLAQGDAKIVLNTPYHPSSEMAAHHMLHGDGVKIIGLKVRDADTAYKEAISRGAKGLSPPKEYKDYNGKVKIASIGTYGDTIHNFIERDEYEGTYLPGYQDLSPSMELSDNGIERIDHIVGNVDWYEMEPTVKFYHEVFGFERFIEFTEKDIGTKYSTLRSQVVRNYNDKVKMPINEPWMGIKKSQIEEYVQYYHGAGAQHIALHTSDILTTVASLKDRGVEFIHVPNNYYDNISDRIGPIKENIDDCEELGVLLDKDKDGYLLQLFTRPIQDRPTFFFEIIQRRGARGFGKGNFQSLFEAIEREQAERGNL
ncbi:MAG: 4-hydroxyphenylpyruvate dioxygenase [Candidatus Thorarchaeota archaeon]